MAPGDSRFALDGGMGRVSGGVDTHRVFGHHKVGFANRRLFSGQKLTVSSMDARIPRPQKTIEVDGGLLTARVALDQHYAETFEEACNRLLDSGVRDLVLDLSHIDFVSSACFGIILSLSVRCVSRGKELSMRVKPELVSVLDLLGIRSMVPTTVVHTGQTQRDFTLQGDRLVVRKELETVDRGALHVWCRRLLDVVGPAPVVDLTHVRHISSACIGVLTEFWAWCKEREKQPIYEVSPQVHARLKEINLDRVFHLRVVK